MSVIGELDHLERITDAAAADWDSNATTPALRQFHTATYPATVKELITELRQAVSRTARLEQDLAEADDTIGRVTAVVKAAPTELDSTSPTNGWVRGSILQLALEGLVPKEVLVDMASPQMRTTSRTAMAPPSANPAIQAHEPDGQEEDA